VRERKERKKSFRRSSLNVSITS